MICEMGEISKKSKADIVYEILIAVLALVAVITNIIDFSKNINMEVLNNGILIVFATDYFSRMFFSRNKKKFFKENILDLIAIIPFNSLFRAFRIVRLVKVVRLTKAIKILRVFTFSKKFHNTIKKFLRTNGFIYMIYITIFIIFLGSILLYIVEKNNVVTTYEDAVWLSFCSASLFGYEGIETLSLAGKIITGTLVISGIFFTGMFTATSATFFIRKQKNAKIEAIENRIIDLSDLNIQQFDEAMNYIKYVRSR
ncbi:ion transporter [Marinisporobacter balticus]|uniref:Voltage-gated potassium channel n=1 Tax=Marinisporobacter balticus TaxID=2018667 RepID=A0A4R2KHP1_9FIRM|nr:ion transporter [Marinisporobacter balticus]TCO69518.1 voltage-gated potassium channel [Marinisporobacter balticus]